MSDEKLRELERRFKETGSVEDEAAWLKERVRVGDLTQERLELAAYCGHEGAGVAGGSPTPSDLVGLQDWILGLLPWGSRVVHAALIWSASEALNSAPLSSECSERLAVGRRWAELRQENEAALAAELANTAMSHSPVGAKEESQSWLVQGVLAAAIQGHESRVGKPMRRLVALVSGDVLKLNCEAAAKKAAMAATARSALASCGEGES